MLEKGKEKKEKLEFIFVELIFIFRFYLSVSRDPRVMLQLEIIRLHNYTVVRDSVVFRGIMTQ